MESHPAELLRDVLALPLEARSALIDSLIESLDATLDEGAAEAWKREIERLCDQLTHADTIHRSHSDEFARF